MLDGQIQGSHDCQDLLEQEAVMLLQTPREPLGPADRASAFRYLEAYVPVLNRAKGTYAPKTTASDVLLIGSHLLIDKYE